MANEQNLIPAKPGEVRNPKGKRPGTKMGIVACLRHHLEKPCPTISLETLARHGIVVDPATTAADAMAQVYILLGLNGDVAAFRLILEYLESKPTQSMKVERTVFRIIPPPPPDGETEEGSECNEGN
jgi:hypothetical protein